MPKGRKRKQRPVAQIMPPTIERERHNEFRSAGMARRVVPVIEKLFRREMISPRQYEALAYYRDQAGLADKSPLKSCIDFSVKGGGNGPGIAIVSACYETGKLEYEMGELWEVARRIAVDDWTLERWCCEKYGTVEERGNVMPINPDRHIALTVLELQFAASRIDGLLSNRR